MLFLVISTPDIAPPEAVKAARRAFRDWLRPLEQEGAVRAFYPLVGRGSVVVFDVPSNEALHRLLTRWADLVLARFEIRALVDPEAAERLLD